MKERSMRWVQVRGMDVSNLLKDGNNQVVKAIIKSTYGTSLIKSIVLTCLNMAICVGR